MSPDRSPTREAAGLDTDPAADGEDRQGPDSIENRNSYTNARALQRTCHEIVESIHNNHILAYNGWGSALSSAPSAISVMAFCLQLAGEKKATGIGIEDPIIRDAQGINPVGSLPSYYLYTNLQHLGDLGRHAFLDAQKHMSYLESVSRTMIGESGSIGYIVELLEDPEDAKVHLGPEIQRIKDVANGCYVNATEVVRKFNYWDLVICHIQKAVMNLNSAKQTEKEQKVEEADRVREKQDRFRREQEAVEKAIAGLKLREDEARQGVLDAESEVDRLQDLPPHEVFTSDDIAAAVEAVPFPKVAKKKKPIAKFIVQKQRLDHVVKAGEERLEKRRAAIERLNEAREKLKNCTADVFTAMKEQLDKRLLFEEAKENLDRANRQLRRLGSQEVELKDIIDTLATSIQDLAQLKEYLDNLVNFFEGIQTLVNTTVQHHAKIFVEPLTREMMRANPGRTGEFRLRQASKRRVLNAAFELQGRFSTIADISSTYVKISHTYIRPGINKMEVLASTRTSDARWPTLCDRFTLWCEDAITGIQRLVTETGENLRENVSTQVHVLRERAIMAAEEANEE
ncbi:hypothetical protein B0O99DRAFT_696204 [Bisporella sp. PMI_857]|nr:hypothetical protein B0O99DRAFT_696204 [Bisporella sp. PMI_857]